MILYNVTLTVENEILDEWLIWMKNVHLPEVMATGKFLSYSFYKTKNHYETDHTNNFSVQYHANSIKEYDDYLSGFAPLLRQKTALKFGDRVLSFRTILEKIE